GIRDKLVTGVQTCALPISLSPLVSRRIRQTKLLPAGPPKRRCLWCAFFSSLRFLRAASLPRLGRGVSALSLFLFHRLQPELAREIGRASCRERVERWVGVG